MYVVLNSLNNNVLHASLTKLSLLPVHKKKGANLIVTVPDIDVIEEPCKYVFNKDTNRLDRGNPITLDPNSLFLVKSIVVYQELIEFVNSMRWNKPFENQGEVYAAKYAQAISYLEKRPTDIADIQKNHAAVWYQAQLSSLGYESSAIAIVSQHKIRQQELVKIDYQRQLLERRISNAIGEIELDTIREDITKAYYEN